MSKFLSTILICSLICGQAHAVSMDDPGIKQGVEIVPISLDDPDIRRGMEVVPISLDDPNIQRGIELISISLDDPSINQGVEIVPISLDDPSINLGIEIFPIILNDPNIKLGIEIISIFKKRDKVQVQREGDEDGGSDQIEGEEGAVAVTGGFITNGETGDTLRVALLPENEERGAQHVTEVTMRDGRVIKEQTSSPTVKDFNKNVEAYGELKDYSLSHNQYRIIGTSYGALAGSLLGIIAIIAMKDTTIALGLINYLGSFGLATIAGASLGDREHRIAEKQSEDRRQAYREDLRHLTDPDQRSEERVVPNDRFNAILASFNHTLAAQLKDIHAGEDTGTTIGTNFELR